MGSCSASPLGRLVEETTVSSIFFSFWFLVSGLCFRVWSSDFRILGVYWPLVAVNSRPPETCKYPHLTLCSQILVLPPDTAKNGRTLLSVPKHSQTSQDAAKTPPRRPRGLQDRPKTPKMTPKAPPRGLMLEPRELQKTNKNMWFLLLFSRIQPLLFTLCSMLIKNGLKMSSRSLQERSKMPQDVQRPPT